jgi:hypothetical protein
MIDILGDSRATYFDSDSNLVKTLLFLSAAVSYKNASGRYLFFEELALSK